jgi:hypothetical protein
MPAGHPLSRTAASDPFGPVMPPSLLPTGVSAGERDRVVAAYGRLPLTFEENRGHGDAPVKFVARGAGYALFLTRSGPILSLARGGDGGARTKQGQQALVGIKFLGARQQPKLEGSGRLGGRVNYLIGRDRLRWRTNVATYREVSYRRVWRGIDVAFYGRQGGQLEYDFRLAPGADPAKIAWRFSGARALRKTSNGDLLVKTGAGWVRQARPQAFQVVHGERRAVASSYVVSGRRLGIGLGAYDHRLPLVIDPVLAYSTYLGGSSPDYGYAIAVDGSGAAYVTGGTYSSDFPTKDALQGTNGGSVSDDVFVTKLNPAGSELVYSTYLGGSGVDDGYGIAVDGTGAAYVTGVTTSSNFPTKEALQSTKAGDEDAFIAKLNPAGSALAYSTYLGGSDFDFGYGIAVDGTGAAYVTGRTVSPNFPTKDAMQSANAGFEDAFIAKLNPAGSALVYSTYLGGSGNESGRGIAVDGAGAAYLGGETGSPNFPTKDALQNANAGSDDAFIAKLNPAGSALVYSTYLGGIGAEDGFAIAVDGAGAAYITGQTLSYDFPTRDALQSTKDSFEDAFITKLNPAGSELVYSTYLGGNSEFDAGRGIAVDEAGAAYLAGYTTSSNFPTKGAVQGTYADAGGLHDAFVAKLDPGVPTLSISDASADEGTDAVFTVSLSNPSAQDVGFSYATQGMSATGEADYGERSATGTILAGQLSTTLAIPTLEDQTDEPDESFALNVSNPTGATIADGQGLATITDDDPVPSLAVSDASADEGTDAVFTLGLSNPSSQDIGFSYATQGTSATGEADYSERSGTGTIPAGQLSTTLTIPTLEDQTDEPDESFALNVSSPTGATIADGQGLATIKDDDEPPARALPGRPLTSGSIGCSRRTGSCRAALSGRVPPPALQAAAVAPSIARSCPGGRVLLQLYSGRRRLFSVRVRTTGICRYRLARRFRRPGRARSLIVRTRFAGTSTLRPRSGRSVRIKIRLGR